MELGKVLRWGAATATMPTSLGLPEISAGLHTSLFSQRVFWRWWGPWGSGCSPSRVYQPLSGNTTQWRGWEHHLVLSKKPRHSGARERETANQHQGDGSSLLGSSGRFGVQLLSVYQQSDLGGLGTLPSQSQLEDIPVLYHEVLRSPCLPWV